MFVIALTRWFKFSLYLQIYEQFRVNLWITLVLSITNRLQQGRVYVAPPDQHLIIENDRVKLVHGPKENLHRLTMNLEEIELDESSESSGNYVSFTVMAMQLEVGTPELAVITPFDVTEQIQLRSD